MAARNLHEALDARALDLGARRSTPPTLADSEDARRGRGGAASAARALTRSTTYNPSWRWDEFASRDAASRALVEQLPGGVFLNVTPMTMLRPDGHVGCPRTGSRVGCDCLHYFLPGPMDAWVQVLQNVLAGLLAS